MVLVEEVAVASCTFPAPCQPVRVVAAGLVVVSFPAETVWEEEAVATTDEVLTVPLAPWT